MRVLGVGFAFLDLVMPLQSPVRIGEKQLTDSFRVGFGGPAIVGVAAAARLGASGVAVAPIGDDAYGRELTESLEQSDLDTSELVVRAGLPTALSVVLVEPSGSRTIVSRVADGLSDRPSDSVMDRIRRRVLDSDAVMVDVRWPAAAREVLIAACETGVPTVLDLDRFDLSHRDDLLSTVSMATHVFASEEALREFHASVGSGPDGRIMSLAEARRALLSLAEASRKASDSADMLTRPDQVFGVTLGERGVAWLGSDGKAQACPAYSVDVRETLGAGDVWHGAFTLAVAQGRELEEAIDFAAAAAAIRCSRTCADALPDADAVADLRSGGTRGAVLR